MNKKDILFVFFLREGRRGERGREEGSKNVDEVACLIKLNMKYKN